MSDQRNKKRLFQDTQGQATNLLNLNQQNSYDQISKRLRLKEGQLNTTEDFSSYTTQQIKQKEANEALRSNINNLVDLYENIVKDQQDDPKMQVDSEEKQPNDQRECSNISDLDLNIQDIQKYLAKIEEEIGSQSDQQRPASFDYLENVVFLFEYFVNADCGQGVVLYQGTKKGWLIRQTKQSIIQWCLRQIKRSNSEQRSKYQSNFQAIFTKLYYQYLMHLQNSKEMDCLNISESDLHFLEILLKMIRIFGEELELPDLDYHSQDSKEKRASQIQQLVSFCLCLDPNSQKYLRIRYKAIAALFKISNQLECSTKDGESFILTTVKNLLGDQNIKIRKEVIKRITDNFESIISTQRNKKPILSQLSCQSPTHQSMVSKEILQALVEAVCLRLDQENGMDKEIKQAILRMIVMTCNNMQDLKSSLEDKPSLTPSLVILLLCKQIRQAMDKNMRIFCAKLLTQIENIDEEDINQMMQKEEFTFNQKFTEIGSVQDQKQQRKERQEQLNKMKESQRLSSEKDDKVKKNEESKMEQENMLIKLDGNFEEQKHHHVQGILLLLLEDDSMMVRLAGIRAMSIFAQKCPRIRSRCLRFLIDMLNDEIDEVRVGALHGISRFNEVLILNDYEVETVLFNLNEDNVKLRSEIYRFFGETIIDRSFALFMKLIDRLLKNLIKYQHQDKHMIFRLMRKLGKSHHKLIVSSYHKILDVDKRFLSQGPQQNDTCYLAKVILICQAAQSHEKATNSDSKRKIIDILDTPPFFLEKDLDYFKDRYSQYFENDEDQVREGMQNLNIDSSSKNKRHRISSLNLVARASDSQTQPPTVLKLQRANSLNLNAANQHLVQRIGQLFGSNINGCLDYSNLTQIMQLTKNSLNQLRAMTKNNNLLEISHNQIDQCLAFAHLLAKIMHCGRIANNSNTKDKMPILSLQQIREIFQTKIQIDAYFQINQNTAQKGISRQIINTQVAKLLLSVLCVSLKTSLKRDVFDHEKFIRGVQNIWTFTKQQLGHNDQKNSQNRLNLGEQDEVLEQIFNNIIQKEILGRPVAELFKVSTRQQILDNLTESMKKLSDKALTPDQELELLSEIEQVQYTSAFIHRPNPGGIGSMAQGAQGVQGGDSQFFDQNDQIHSGTQNAFIFNSRHLEFITVKVSQLIGKYGEDEDGSVQHGKNTAPTVLCLRYPSNQSMFKTLKSGGNKSQTESSRNFRGIEGFVSQVELQMNCESWNQEAPIEMFIVKQEDSELNNNFIWQIIKDLAGDSLANYLLSCKTNTNDQKCFQVISSRGDEKLGVESRSQRLVLINSNVQNMVIKPV